MSLTFTCYYPSGIARWRTQTAPIMPVRRPRARPTHPLTLNSEPKRAANRRRNQKKSWAQSMGDPQNQGAVGAQSKRQQQQKQQKPKQQNQNQNPNQKQKQKQQKQKQKQKQQQPKKKNQYGNKVWSSCGLEEDIF